MDKKKSLKGLPKDSYKKRNKSTRILSLISQNFKDVVLWRSQILFCSTPWSSSSLLRQHLILSQSPVEVWLYSVTLPNQAVCIQVSDVTNVVRTSYAEFPGGTLWYSETESGWVGINAKSWVISRQPL